MITANQTIGDFLNNPIVLMEYVEAACCTAIIVSETTNASIAASLCTSALNKYRALSGSVMLKVISSYKSTLIIEIPNTIQRHPVQLYSTYYIQNPYKIENDDSLLTTPLETSSPL